MCKFHYSLINSRKLTFYFYSIIIRIINIPHFYSLKILDVDISCCYHLYYCDDHVVTSESEKLTYQKLNFLQERYRKYQEAMRAQDANRRRHPSSDTSRDTLSGRSLSLGSSKPAPLLPPPPPPRAMIQSASVCDLTAAHMWNPGMHQVCSIFSNKYF